MPGQKLSQKKIFSNGFLDREQIVAKAGFNRWLVPPAALAIHLCIGMSYGFSVFWLPLSHILSMASGSQVPACSAHAVGIVEKAAATFGALSATNCEWSQFDLGWMFTLFFVVLGCSAAFFGGWLERVGPRLAGLVAAVCWSLGLAIGALGIFLHQLWLLWLGPGVIGGIGLGLGYISPVSTLIKWFPDKRGMATGMAIMGFGGGAMIGSPLATLLMNGGNLIEWKGLFSFIHLAGFKDANSPGVWQTFLVLAAIYFVYMVAGSLAYRIPPENWEPQGWTPKLSATKLLANTYVHLKDVHKTPQFWLIWAVLCLNVSAGIGIIGAAAPMLQETFGGLLLNAPNLDFAQLTDAQKIAVAAVGSGFVGLFSLFNIAGRFFWSSLSDKIGRKSVYYIFFGLGLICFLLAPSLANNGHLALFAGLTCIIASMYGGGFAAIPAYLADTFGTRHVGAIHGRLLTAWSTAGIVGPVIVNYLHDGRVAAGMPYSQIYNTIFYSLSSLLFVGFVCNHFIKPVSAEWHSQHDQLPTNEGLLNGSFGIGLGGFNLSALLAWTSVALPLAWGVLRTLQNVLKIF